MNEYWVLLFFVGLGTALVWVLFRQLAKLVIWSSRPKLDAWRYGIITFCLSIEVGDTFELWEGALIGFVSFIAYRVSDDQQRGS